MSTFELIDELEAGELSVEFEGAEPQELLAWALERFSPRIAISTAFQIDGVALIDMAYEIDPEIKVIVLSVSSDRSLIDNVLKRGASAYIVKSVNPVDLPSVIRQALEETVYTAVGLPDDPSSRAAKAAGLTERELAILTALARGMSNAAIAKQLWVAQQTVKFHLTNIYRKLGVANRTEAARYAYQQGLIESPLHEDEEVPLD